MPPPWDRGTKVPGSARQCPRRAALPALPREKGGTYSGPLKTKKSPAPAFHAASQAVRRELWDAYGWFVGAFRQAAEKLRAGDRNAAFPVGSFPPALKFVGG